MLNEELVKELNKAKDEIFVNLKGISEGIEMVQDSAKVRKLKLKVFVKLICER